VAALLLSACNSDEPNDAGVPDTTAAASERPINCPPEEETAFDARELVGESVQDAARLARRNDCSVRVVERDGQPLPGTDDFVPSRINVVIDDGLVTQVADVG
jgi:hypothetical protein